MTSPTRRAAKWLLRLLYENRGQDLIEYALLASLVAVAAGAVIPPVTTQVSTIYSKVKCLFALTPG